MQQPQIENIPDFVMNNGKKNLSEEVVANLKALVVRLKLVNITDKAKALNHIGVLESYLNNSEKAVDAFKKSISFDFSELVYSNYLQALELSGSYELATQEAITFLERNPNNKKIYNTALSFITKYYLKNEINQILSFSAYHEDEASIREAAEFKDMYIKDFTSIDKLNIDIEYLNLIINLAFRETKKIQNGQVNIETNINEINQLSILFNIYGIGFEDIKVLNKNFDDQIFKMIECKDIDSSIYFDHLLKVSIGFTIASDNRKAA
jgi:tetratricopeptide (TPR) repeat protein